jgi:hypothetical protein
MGDSAEAKSDRLKDQHNRWTSPRSHGRCLRLGHRAPGEAGAPGKLSASSAWRCAEDGGKVVLEEPLEET